MDFRFDFTVFTPTFNRRELLPRVFESLCRQTFRSFEWVVIDDGSTDGTGELVQRWAATADFPVRYYWQVNSGKHVAINRGVEKAEGYFFLVLDSDDWLAPHCLERLKCYWAGITEEKRPSFAGIAALWESPSGEVVGSSFPEDILDSDSIEIRIRYRVKGDNFGINRTEVMREFPFPENLGRFVTEAVVWNRIAQKYQCRFVNEVLAFKDFQKGGLTDKKLAILVQSSLATQLYYKEFVSMTRPLPLNILVRSYANYVRYSMHSKCSIARQVLEVPSKFLWTISLPVGLITYIRDRIIIKNSALPR